VTIAPQRIDSGWWRSWRSRAGHRDQTFSGTRGRRWCP
jgi:hypothetical protein